MRISSKSRHAITCMLELGLQFEKGTVSLTKLADTHNISLSYLEQIFSELRAKGLVRGQRGPGGGYLLAKNPSEISITDIICAVDEWVDYSFSKPKTIPFGQQGETAMTLWNKLSQDIYDYLSAITLDNVKENDIAPLAAVTDSFLDKAA